ncbi:MAG: hypothetical protein RMK84_13225 [Oscillochloridaceae bacterium]|nr:hypothetical protein [Chloroflexaceae bacterium]MDW8391082.1 hypothetical protein [Oscillochloridaceae bacterium]
MKRYLNWIAWLCVVLPGLLMAVVGLAQEVTLTSSTARPAILSETLRIGGGSDKNDQRDTDIYPAIAHDGRRYLVVWLSPRNAWSSSDGLDVYGVFLDQNGSPVGNEFRISDSNTVARSAPPSVAAGNNEFAVVWTVRGNPCRIAVQRIADSSSRPDRTLVEGTGHRHTTSLVYNATNQRYVLAFVEGDDYQAPTFLGAQTSDCGNNASSTSRIRALEFDFSSEGESPVIRRAAVDVSAGSRGAFRPRLALSANRYLVVWEDRRDAGGQTHRFDVFAQILDADLTRIGNEIPLATNNDYTNYGTTTTWTPRPVVSGGEGRFQASWFERREEEDAIVWFVRGRVVSSDGVAAGNQFTIAEVPFAEAHSDQPPTGFLASGYLAGIQEYLVGITIHSETVWGYKSFALAQRVSKDGQLIQMNGTVRSSPGVGDAIDNDTRDQVSIALAIAPTQADAMAVYAKPLAGRPALDYDVWRVRIQIGSTRTVYFPTIRR